MKKVTILYQFFVVLCIGLMLSLFLGAKKAKKETVPLLTESLLDGLKWRCIGPANMGGRIDDFAVVKSNPKVIYAGTASGGLWKTTNNGVTWEPIFDDQATSSIGDVAVAPSNPDVIWVGTGEPNNRQSSSWGTGVYKSIDGGMTWKNMGLRDTHHIGRIVIHPRNQDIVYVAALGHLWGPNKERGLFRTKDGGKTWVNSKFIDENTGFIDVAIDLENPNVLYAAAYQRRRRGWGFNGGGPGSGLYKTEDGGETWVLLTNGLPPGDKGRIGIDIYRSNSSIVYAIIEHKQGGVFRSEDKGLTWKKVSSTNPRPMYYSQIRIDPNNEQRVWVLGDTLYVSEDGGKTFSADLVRVREVHSDHHALWINPSDSNHMVLGSDGGIYFSYDRGKYWDFINTLPIGQFYEIGFDMRKPYYVYGGLQDNACWGGPSATWYSGITNEDWYTIGGSDGFYTQVDPTDYNTIYAESQRGDLFRFDLRSRERMTIKPDPEDEKEVYRFNWNSPLLISPHDPKTIYLGGNKLFKSKKRGETWEASIDLTTQQDREKLPLMGVLPDKDTLSREDRGFYGTLTTISESPLKEGLLYAGTDDGNLQVCRDGGKTWKNVISKVARLPKYTFVTRVIASRFGEGTAYATFDGHRDNDFKAYVFMTTDYGESWKNISANLPHGGIVNVIREHHRNPNLLFVGTERGAYFSIDRGRKWVKFKNNFPIVPVDDIAIHPRENDLIFGTHGRSIWVLDDITPLEQLTKNTLASPVSLFDIRKATIFKPYHHEDRVGHKLFVAPNPPFGAMISYYLKEEAKEDVKIIIQDSTGGAIRELEGSRSAGINRITWNLRYGPQEATGEQRVDRRFRTRAPFVLPGEYQVKLKAAGQEMTKTVQVEGDPRIDTSFEDLKAQHNALFSLSNLSPALSAASRASDKIRNEIKMQERTLKKVPDVPESIHESLKAISKEIDDIRLKLLGNPELGRRGMRFSVSGRILGLGRSIGGYTGAPSEQQVQRIKKYSEEFKALIERINNIIEVDIAKLNEVMKKNNIPLILVGEKIKIS